MLFSMCLFFSILFIGTGFLLNQIALSHLFICGVFFYDHVVHFGVCCTGTAWEQFFANSECCSLTLQWHLGRLSTARAFYSFE